jgi:hypothetical protein
MIGIRRWHDSILFIAPLSKSIQTVPFLSALSRLSLTIKLNISQLCTLYFTFYSNISTRTKPIINESHIRKDDIISLLIRDDAHLGTLIGDET